jgi:hypothetical protein
MRRTSEATDIAMNTPSENLADWFEGRSDSFFRSEVVPDTVRSDTALRDTLRNPARDKSTPPVAAEADAGCKPEPPVWSYWYPPEEKKPALAWGWTRVFPYKAVGAFAALALICLFFLWMLRPAAPVVAGASTELRTALADPPQQILLIRDASSAGDGHGEAKEGEPASPVEVSSAVAEPLAPPPTPIVERRDQLFATFAAILPEHQRQPTVEVPAHQKKPAPPHRHYWPHRWSYYRHGDHGSRETEATRLMREELQQRGMMQ